MAFYILLATATFIASLIQGVSGFAFGMILVSILPHFMMYTQAIALSSLLGVILTGINAWTYHEYTVWKLLPAVTFSYILCARIGIWILTTTAASAVWNKVLGLLLMIWAVYVLYINGQVSIKPTAKNGILWGALGGTLSGLFGMAPIMVFYFLAVTSGKNSYMGSLQMFFFIGGSFDIFFRFQSGMVTLDVIKTASFALIFVLAGFISGRLLLKKLSMPQMQKIIYGLIFICGLSLLIF